MTLLLYAPKILLWRWKAHVAVGRSRLLGGAGCCGVSGTPAREAAVEAARSGGPAAWVRLAGEGRWQLRRWGSAAQQRHLRRSNRSGVLGSWSGGGQADQLVLQPTSRSSAIGGQARVQGASVPNAEKF